MKPPSVRVFWFLCAVLASPARGDGDDDDPEPKLSLPTEADRAAWQRPGFRLGLSFGYGSLVGLGGAPDATVYAATARAGLRLDERWSIASSFQYAYATGSLTGIRFAGTLDPTWHPRRDLAISIGVGFGGVVEPSSSRTDAMPYAEELESSYTFPDASTPMAKCSGVGAAGLARAEYGYVLGPRMQATISLELIAQWTRCIDETGRVEPDTGDAIVRRQYWPHAGGTLAVGFAWR